MPGNTSVAVDRQNPGDRTAPIAKLRVEWVYGYRSANCRSNIHLTENGELVYFTAAVAIVQSIKEKDGFHQRFFLAHDGHIISSALHPKRIIVATGQMGKSAQICVWNTQEGTKMESILYGHTDGVGAMNFSADGEKLASVGIDAENTVKIWNWAQGKMIASVAGHHERVFDICYSEDKVITCGVKHMRFWTLLGNTLQPTDGLFGKSEVQTLLCIGHFPKGQTRTGDESDLCFTGSISGDIYIWKGTKVYKTIDRAHKSTIYSIDVNPDGFLTSGKDGFVQQWGRDFSLLGEPIPIPCLMNDTDDVSVCSVTTHNGYCVVGTRDSEIYGFALNDNPIPELLVQGHHDDALHALACHPQKNLFATGGDDHSLRFWNADRMVPFHFYITPDNHSTPLPSIRSLAFSADGERIAVGYENGLIEIYPTPSKGGGEHRVRALSSMHNRVDRIQALAFSPKDTYLAAGCIDGKFDIYDAKNNFADLHVQSPNNSCSIMNVDWTDDGKYFQFTGEKPFVFTAKTGSWQEISTDEQDTIENWATITGLRHREVKGVWNKFAEKTDIVTIDGNKTDGVIAAGDEQGLIKLFRFPSEQRGAHFKKYLGHSSRIANVCFVHDSSRLISIGTDDRTIIQWKFSSESDSFAMVESRRLSSAAPLGYAAMSTGLNADDLLDATIAEAQAMETALQPGAYLDSDSEDSDSDLSAAEIDSDIEKEKQFTYDRTLYREDYQKLKKVSKKKLAPGEKRTKQPNEGLTLDYVFGYRGYDCRDNVFCLKSGEIVYHVAALGIVLNTEQNLQRFYNGHTDDILCLAVSPDMTLVATGQIGRDPPVHVWDPTTTEAKSILKGAHFRGICALGFSKDGKRLASVGLDDYRMIVIWDWKKGEKLASQRGHNDKIFCLRWNPHQNEQFVTVGVKHIKFWTQAGGGMTSKQGIFGKSAGKQGKQNQMCVVFGKTADSCITGGGDGAIYIWTQTSLTRRVDKAHEGPLFAITLVQDKGYATGGKDGKVILWDMDFKKPIKIYELTNKNVTPDSRGQLTEGQTSIRAVTLTRRIVVGTRGGEICEIEKDGRIRVVAQGHAEGEMWGLCTHPKKHEICTVSDDKTVRIWSLTERRMLRFKAFDKLLRACEYSQDGQSIAVGTKDGQVMILRAADLSSILTPINHRNQEVSDVKFSPNDRYLAVGTHDNFVDIYSVESQKRVGICKVNSSYITHVDWDKQSKLIMTNSGAREHLFYEAPRGTRITSIKTTDIEKIEWFTWSGVLGLVCDGIWPAEADITDINSTHLTRDKQTLATGDDFGMVKLFDFPAKGKAAKYKRYTGHSAHVTRVRWTWDDSYLVSIGGRDVAALVWKHDRDNDVDFTPNNNNNNNVLSRTTARNVSANPNSTTTASTVVLRRDRGESDDSDNTDSEEEGYDSDVQHDRDMDYNQRFLINPIRAKAENKGLPRPTTNTTRKPMRTKVKPSQHKVQEELALLKVAMKARHTLDILSAAQGNATTDDVVHQESKLQGAVGDLQLDHIHGYRGFDCRDNLFYLADNESIVYPAAGAGVVHNIRRGTQQFYLNHTDDIISMAVHNGGKHGNIVASGQIGENPTIHVWNPLTRKTLSVLSGKHKKGVCSLSFSGSGKLLLSLGVDAPFTIAVWRWEEGVNIACTVGSEHRIFRALFRPDSETQFVSAGVKHLKFWSVAGNTLVEKKAVITKSADGKRSAKMQTMLSIAFQGEKRTYTGSMTGLVFIWHNNNLERTIAAHLGPIFSVYSADNCLVTGAKEKRSTGSSRELKPLKVWDFELTKEQAIKLDIPPTDVVCVRSVCRNAQGKLLVGLKTADIIEVDQNSCKSLVFGHGEGQLWALSPHPTEMIFATGSYDRNLVVWDISERNGGLIAKRNMGKEIRSISFDGKGNLIAVGFKDGQISLVVFTKENKDLDDVFKTRERNAAIVCIRFSPDSKLLAASSENCCIDLFEVQAKRLTRVGYITRIQDVVAQMDWSVDSKYIRASTACYHALVYQAPTGEELKNHDEIEKITWNTWTSTIGDDIIGIWPKDVKKDHINCAHATSSTIVTGDDNGAVNLFKFPCPEPGAEHKSFYGHSDNVTNVRFLANERYLVSLGGDDCCIFLWKCVPSTEVDDDD